MIDGLVSIVVPFLNAERFLGETIESVLAQTYENWELILVDDGSRDGSARVAQRYAADWSEQVALVRQPDGRSHGAASARNLGIAHARGEYLAFLDADDVWVSTKLHEQTEALTQFPEVALVYGVTLWWYSWTGRRDDIGRDHVEPLGVPPGVFASGTLLAPFFLHQTAAILSTSGLLVRRSVIGEVGGFEEGMPNGYEDQAFCAKVLAHRSVLVMDRCWDHYRQHPESLTARVATNGSEFSARADFLAWLAEYLRSVGIDGRLGRAIRRERFLYAHPLAYRLAGRARGA
jgi:glycosyltransferase involved in cell wall biosynthesis